MSTEQQKTPKNNPVNATLAQVRELISNGRYYAGITLLETALAHGQNDINVYLQLTKLLVTTGQFEEALTTIEVAEQFDLVSTELQRQKGRIALFQGDYVQAIVVFMELTASIPENYNIWWGLATANLAIGYLDQAESFYRRCIKTAPDKLRPYLGLALLLRAKGDIRAAEIMLSKFIEPKVNQLCPYSQCYLLVAQGDYYTALEKLKLAIERNQALKIYAKHDYYLKPLWRLHAFRRMIFSVPAAVQSQPSNITS